MSAVSGQNVVRALGVAVGVAGSIFEAGTGIASILAAGITVRDWERFSPQNAHTRTDMRIKVVVGNLLAAIGSFMCLPATLSLVGAIRLTNENKMYGVLGCVLGCSLQWIGLFTIGNGPFPSAPGMLLNRILHPPRPAR